MPEIPGVPVRRCWRHWYAYYGRVGSSAPVCQRYACDAPNPHYRREDDPRA